jgi:hypothetical protein
MSVINSAFFLLATVATPINSAYSRHNACAQLTGMQYKQVKIVKMYTHD